VEVLARSEKRNCLAFKARGSDEEADFEDDADHGSSQALHLTDGSRFRSDGCFCVVNIACSLQFVHIATDAASSGIAHCMPVSIN
jgi:hypothetical protein